MIHPYYKTPYLLHLIRTGELKQVVLYLMAGMITSVSDYVLFAIFLNSGLFAATAVSYLGGLIVSYFLSRYFVFNKNAYGQQFKTGLKRYITLLAFNFLLTYVMLWALEHWLGISPLIGKFIVWTFLTFWNFAANKYWVFKGPRQVKKSIYYK